MNKHHHFSLAQRGVRQGFQCVIIGQPTDEMIFCETAPRLGEWSDLKKKKKQISLKKKVQHCFYINFLT